MAGKAVKQGIFRKKAGKARDIYGFWQWETGKIGFFQEQIKCALLILQYCVLALLVNLGGVLFLMV